MEVKMTELLKNKDTVKLETPKTQKLAESETKKLEKSSTRAKKDKAKYKVNNPENALLLKLKDGDVVIEMFDDDAPKHVERIKELVRQGFYNGLKFHRVIDGFMAQTGCPYGTGTGGSGKKLKAEFNNKPHVRGAVSMARAADPDSADSQFFICFKIIIFVKIFADIFKIIFFRNFFVKLYDFTIICFHWHVCKINFFKWNK